MEGAHPAILQRLLETNLEKSAGYGYDTFSESAREKIRIACGALFGEAAALSEKVDMAFWENTDDSHIVMRIATSWATTDEDVEKLIECL